MKSFSELSLNPSIMKALEAMSFTTPTPIQAEAIPVALTRRDLIGCAQTGTGKTGAFCIPTLTHLLENPTKQALVLVPTRELATQIEMFWRNLAKFVPGASCVSLIGGMAMNGQLNTLRNRRPRFIIATPGRLLDHLQRGSVSLQNTDTLILDEADRMLDMGFAPQLSQILRYLPQARQTLFFSATWAPSVDSLAAKYIRNDPARVTIGTSNTAAPKIVQTTIETTVKEKNNTLVDQLNQREGSVLIFARTQARTDRLARYLNDYGLDVGRIHGGRTQGQRNSALMGFRTGKIRILVATDIAARGIDVADIAHVINYDLPQQAEDYIHRIGRTGRAGAEGEALSLITPEDRAQWRDITRLMSRKGGAPELASAGQIQGQGQRNERVSNRGDNRGDSRGNIRSNGPVARDGQQPRQQDGQRDDQNRRQGRRASRGPRARTPALAAS